ncbi:MAG: hypothetical protein J7604_07115 [Sporocytophaga sp.]|uniref:M12 family metallopeptidase n=1 Tax=Sporocytophaga sp. TaxID=2231183 RepID=UPI001AFF4737|nr:M12 family metallopeptidase [Sporocytophaga sp.]MBO9699963.1 hypothetical protein [Sporocytophaga sp.]
MIKKILVLTICFGAFSLSSCKKEKVLDPKTVDEATHVHENSSQHICTELSINDAGNARTEAAIEKNKMWSTGQTIRIKFMNGDNFVQSKVKYYANRWLNFANLKFQWVESNDSADIRIAFAWNGDGGSWSYIGTDCKYIPVNDPTINFGWFNSATTDNEFSRTTLHEVGHALGLIHEHQSPSASIPWDVQKVYDYYTSTQGWSKAMVDQNIFDKYSATQTNYTEFDMKSIMLYPISSTLTTNGFSTGINYTLSDLDIYFIGQMYPFSETNKQVLFKGQHLSPGQYLTSKDTRFTLRMQKDGNLVLNKINFGPLWSSNTWGKPVNRCLMKNNGNLVLDDNSNISYWASNTANNPGAFLLLQNDGNAVIYQNGSAKWATNTAQ